MDKQQRNDVRLSATNDFTFYNKFVKKVDGQVNVEWVRGITRAYINKNKEN